MSPNRTNNLEDVSCYLCGSDAGTIWATENGYEVRRCAECAILYVPTRPPVLMIDEASRTGTHVTDNGEMNVTGSFARIRQLRLASIVKRLFSDSIARGTPMRWLDIGSGHGELLLALRRILPAGSTVLGVEPNVDKRTEAHRRGADVVGSIDDVAGRFDVISLMNVYSHLPDPVTSLSEFAAFLDDHDGVALLIETGNAAELHDASEYPGQLDLPDHLSFTGEQQLGLLFERLGFRTRTIRRHRLDGVLGTGYQVVRRLRDSSVRVHLPYRSPFRDMFVVASRSRSGADGDTADLIRRTVREDD